MFSIVHRFPIVNAIITFTCAPSSTESLFLVATPPEILAMEAFSLPKKKGTVLVFTRVFCNESLMRDEQSQLHVGTSLELKMTVNTDVGI